LAERQRTLANEVGRNARAALSQPDDKPKRSGTRKARNRRKASWAVLGNQQYARWAGLFAGAPGRIRTRDPLL